MRYTNKLIAVFVIGFFIGGFVFLLIFHPDSLLNIGEHFNVNDNDYLSPYDVHKHPHEYIGTVVTVKGVLNGNVIAESDTTWEEASMYGLHAKNITDKNIVSFASYLFTGKIVHDEWGLHMIVYEVKPL